MPLVLVFLFETSVGTVRAFLGRFFFAQLFVTTPEVFLDNKKRGRVKTEYKIAKNSFSMTRVL